MKDLKEFKNKQIQFLFTDIDDTLTDEGLLKAPAYQALWRLKDNGIKVIPITGRPAGWCELIARQWPVDGVVGENGGFYFRYKNKEMYRCFEQTPEEQKDNRDKLQVIENEVLSEVKGSALASDQFCRLIDLAIDFCEDVPPLEKSEVQKIVNIFKKHGAQAKVSSIHVNGWFGNHNKLSMCRKFLEKEFGLDIESNQEKIVFIGDSPNDEPMFEFFDQSFAVDNIKEFVTDLKHPPKFKTPSRGGQGFTELVDHLLSNT